MISDLSPYPTVIEIGWSVKSYVESAALILSLAACTILISLSGGNSN